MRTRPFPDPIRHSIEKLADQNWWRVLLIWLGVMILRYGIMILFVALIANGRTDAQTLDCKRFLKGHKEVLRYKVRWGFIRLGTVTIQQQPDSSFDPTGNRVIITAQSEPRLPFIDVFFVNQALLSAAIHTSVEFRSDVGKNGNAASVHRIDPLAKKIYLEEYEQLRLKAQDTIPFDQPYYDDVTFIMLWRSMAGSGRTFTVSSIMDRAIAKTQLAFPTSQDEIEVPAFSKRITAHRFEGKGNWTRTQYAGMDGTFCGWISRDSASVLLRAEVKIFLGSVVLELESFETPGWMPNTSLRLLNN